MHASCRKAIKIKLALVSITVLAAGSIESNEHPGYAVLLTDGDVEYRQYDPYLVSETVIRGIDSYRDVGLEGFKRLFAYIRGENSSESKIAMTTPIATTEVTQTEQRESIAATEPARLSQPPLGWAMSFALPAEYDLESAPKPTDDRVYIRLVPGRLMAVRQFSGRWTDRNFSRQEQKLRDDLEAVNLILLGKMERAIYNAPFSLPFSRRNEVMVAIKELPGNGAAELSLSQTVRNSQ